MSVSGPNLLDALENNSESTIKATQHHLRVKQALQDSRAQPNGNCMISLTKNDIMVNVAEKVKEINLSDDSGIDSPSGDVNAEISRKVETDTLSDIIIKNEEASVKGFEETAVDATVGGTCKATGDVRLAPAEQYWCTTRDKAVKLRMSKSGPGSEPPLTIHQMFQWTVDNFGDHPALCFKKDGAWSTLTYKEYHQQCRAAAKSFLKLGLERFHGVGILGFNSPEWFIADIGCIMAGGLGVGIYTTNSPEACHYVAKNCEANIIVVENDKQLEKILEVKDQLPHLKAIVQYKGEVKKKMPDIYTVGLKIN